MLSDHLQQEGELTFTVTLFSYVDTPEYTLVVGVTDAAGAKRGVRLTCRRESLNNPEQFYVFKDRVRDVSQELGLPFFALWPVVKRRVFKRFAPQQDFHRMTSQENAEMLERAKAWAELEAALD